MALPDSPRRRVLLDERCARHQFEEGVDLCRQCGLPFCGECLVYSFGERQPPFCIPCALAASGVRSGAGRAPVLPKKEIRRREKEARKAAKAADEATRSEPAIDWSLPIVGNGATPINGHGHEPALPGAPDGLNGVNGHGAGSDGSAGTYGANGFNGHGTHPEDDLPPAPSGQAPPPPPAPGQGYPSFEDEPSTPRPQAPATPAKTPGKSGLFGRRKNKVVPF